MLPRTGNGSNGMSAYEGFQYSFKEFMAEWDNLRSDVVLFLGDLDSGNDPYDSGLKVKLSSHRISLLSAEIMVFLKRMQSD